MRHLALVVLAALTTSALGCAATPPPPALAAAPARVAKLVVYIAKQAQMTGELASDHSDLATTLPDAVGDALSKAGYTVVTDENAPHDMVGTLSITVTKHMQVFVTYQNGQPVQPATASVHLRLVGSDSTRIEELDAATDGGDPGAQTEIDRIASTLVDAINQSPRVLAFANKSHGDAPASGGSAVASNTTTPNDSSPASSPPASTSTRRLDSAITPQPQSAALMSGAAQPNAYALIVGIERYRDLAGPPGAHADAQAFVDMAKTSLGIREENIRTAYDDHATKSDFEKQLQWLKGNVPPGGRVYFYFSGHGAPDAANGTPYLLPFDGDPKYVAQTAVPLSDVLTGLTATSARDVLVVVDSCFSGEGGRSVLPKGVRPLVRVQDAAPVPKLAIMTASAGNEISGNVPGQDRGLFTKVFVDGLGGGQADANSDGQVTLDELFTFVKPHVLQVARTDNRDQTPGLTLGNGVGDAQSFIVASGLHN